MCCPRHELTVALNSSLDTVLLRKLPLVLPDVNYFCIEVKRNEAEGLVGLEQFEETEKLNLGRKLTGQRLSVFGGGDKPLDRLLVGLASYPACAGAGNWGVNSRHEERARAGGCSETRGPGGWSLDSGYRGGTPERVEPV